LYKLLICTLFFAFFYMLSAPRRTKFRKSHKLVSGLAQKKEFGVNKCTFGRYGIRSLESSRITAGQLEAIRRVRSRERKREGQVWVRVFPSTPVTSKPVGVRRGKGKGSVSYWTATVKAGRRLFELDGISLEKAIRVIKSCQGKMPVRIELVVLNSGKTYQ
jgi:large subunit ribosomal protein L16